MNFKIDFSKNEHFDNNLKSILNKTENPFLVKKDENSNEKIGNQKNVTKTKKLNIFQKAVLEERKY